MAKPWSYKVGTKAVNRVRVFEWAGQVWIDYRENGRRARRSLGGITQARATRLANEISAALLTPNLPASLWRDSAEALGVHQPVPTVTVSPLGRTSIYVVCRSDNGAVKIGRTDDVTKRFFQLQRNTDVELRLVLHFPATAGDELRLHSYFSRERKRGEWYSPHPRVLDWIRRQSIVGGVVVVGVAEESFVA